MRYICVIGLLFCLVFGYSQEQYKFRVWLTDKKDTAFSLEKPERILSSKALARRARYGIPIDSTDLPVSRRYVEQLKMAGFPVITRSKWLNTVVVLVSDSSRLYTLREFPFVREIELVWENTAVGGDFFVDTTVPIKKEEDMSSPYGAALWQISHLEGDRLHSAGFRGKGITIAVIDAGFLNVDRNPGIDKSRILGTRDFVEPNSDIYSVHNHGALVLSAMLGEIENVFCGTAPEADYWLLRSEDSNSEYPVEEDYWAAAAEFADSVGVDVINSSLGYFEFDDPLLNHSYKDFNGESAFISKAAKKAVEKGIIVVNSAGNEGRRPWRKIIFPSDVYGVLAVGAIDGEDVSSDFTGHGYTKNDTVKPDIVALGTQTALLGVGGEVVKADGTSFSAPVVAGLTACLRQALPHLSNKEIVDRIRKSATLYNRPDTLQGYGLPRFYKVYAQESALLSQEHPGEKVCVVPAPEEILLLRDLPRSSHPYTIDIYSAYGVQLHRYFYENGELVIPLQSLPSGLYFILVMGDNFREIQKMIKK